MAKNKEAIPSIWTTGWTDCLNTGTWRNALPVHEKRISPCQEACPINQEIPVWEMQVKDGNYREAWLIIVENNPFPAVIGRVCHHPCESQCNRDQYDGAVAINALEQFLGDLALEQGWALPGAESLIEKKVAIVGGGPAGLSCAYQLIRRGFQVDIYEANPELGGMLRYGISSYRLPKEVLDGEIQRLVALGIGVHTESKVEKEKLSALQKEYEAVFFAIGAQKARKLAQFPDDERIFEGLGFLASVNKGKLPVLGRNVTVIGGGSVAMDVARSARRLGSVVKVLALEHENSLPAQPEEVHEALEEGIKILGEAVVRKVNSSGSMFKLDCSRVILDAAAPPGELRPIIIPGTEFVVEADNIILAVGQEVELEGWKNKLLINNNNVIDIDQDFATDCTGVFAGGDAASLDRFVSVAIGHGKKAAEEIVRFVSGERKQKEEAGLETVKYEEINTFYFPPASRMERECQPAAERVINFKEFREGFNLEQAKKQAERCFSCGHCIQCDNCYYYCPDNAVVKDQSVEVNYRVLEQYCKGCGICVKECPRGAVVLREESQ